MTYKRYSNFYAMLTDSKYRGLDTESKKLSKEEYEQSIIKGMIFVHCAYPKNFRIPDLQSVPVIGIFCAKHTQIIVNTYNTIMDEIKKEYKPEIRKVLIFAVDGELNAHAQAKLAAQPQLEYMRFPTDKFVIKPEESVHMADHSVETEYELKVLRDQQYLEKTNLQTIYMDDAGLIWINAFPGEVVKIRDKSEIVGKNNTYRYVKRRRIRKATK